MGLDRKEMGWFMYVQFLYDKLGAIRVMISLSRVVVC